MIDSNCPKRMFRKSWWAMYGVAVFVALLMICLFFIGYSMCFGNDASTLPYMIITYVCVILWLLVIILSEIFVFGHHKEKTSNHLYLAWVIVSFILVGIGAVNSFMGGGTKLTTNYSDAYIVIALVLWCLNLGITLALYGIAVAFKWNRVK